MHENITKAEHSAGFLVGSLREALSSAGPVEAIVLLDLIEKAVKLETKIKALAEAVSP